MTARRDALLPSLEQELLLGAALASEDREALRQFERWLELVPFDGRHDPGSFGLLPLAWRRLSQAAPAHPLMSRLKGVFRNSWVKMTRFIGDSAEILHALEEGGIRTMICKGLPLALAYYPLPSLRPMNDIDIVVPFDDAPRASALLESMGIVPARRSWTTERRLYHALAHLRADDTQVDLHWHVLYDCPNSIADEHFWSRAVPIQVGTARSLRPAASDLLMQVIIHGLRSNRWPPLRWVADAAMILRSGEPIDWDAIHAFAVQQDLAIRLHLGLAYLRRFDLSVPEEMLRRLASKSSLLEQFELASMRREFRSPGWRHLRLMAQVLRLLKWDSHRATLLLALAREVKLRRSSARDPLQLGPSAP